VGAGGARQLDRQAGVAGVLGDRRAVLDGAAAGAGQADVDVVDAEVAGEIDQPQLVVDRRVDHRRRLDAVAQRLVEERHLALGRQRSDLVLGVPVVDEVALGLPRSSECWAVTSA
jgi:hypothetical protein